MLIINNVIADKIFNGKDAINLISGILKCSPKDIISYNLYKKSIDARRGNIRFVLSYAVEVKNEEKYTGLHNVSKAETLDFTPVKARKNASVIITGFGPAGFMCALTLARAGIMPVVLERGADVDRRKLQVENFNSTFELNPESNIQFGEGGAGTFSDGKLTTGINDPLIRYVLKTFVSFGAPREIEYEAKPHIGTDYLINMVKNIRKEIIDLGGKIYFDTRLSDLKIINGKIAAVQTTGSKATEIVCEKLVLSVGHSARDTFSLLKNCGLNIIQKPFSIGARIEHLQKSINLAQYRTEELTADYKLSCHMKDGRGVYTFCMCPGGSVVAAASKEYGIVTNGMSTFSRNGVNANSALLVSVLPSDFRSDDVLAGVEFQRKYERMAYGISSSYSAPVQTVDDFLKSRPSRELRDIKPTYPKTVLSDLALCLPDFVTYSMRNAITEFDKRLKGFAYPGAVLTGVETRSSSPIRILRDERMESNIKGIYPCGEGAGYAGGIMSAAIDGIKTAQAIIDSVNES